MAHNIKTVTGRSRLKARREPYWERIAAGQHIGYRAGAGAWIAKYRDASTGKRHYNALGEFADLPDHQRYDAAVKAAGEWFTHLERGGAAEVVTVADACGRYVEHLRRIKGDDAAKDAASRFMRHVCGSLLADVQLDKLRPAHVGQWRNDLEDKPTRNGKRSASALNRDMSALRAALNLAHENQLIASNTAWIAKLKPIKNADRRRNVYLDKRQRQQFIEAADVDIAKFMAALSAVPLRPGAMAALTVKDYSKKLKTLTISNDKANAGRKIALPAATARLFADAAMGKLPGAYLFTRADGAQWEKYKWRGPVKEAAIASGMPDGTSLYTLRHSVITDLVHAGADLLTVAQISGTSLAMIDKHYGHLRGSVAAKALEAVAM